MSATVSQPAVDAIDPAALDSNDPGPCATAEPDSFPVELTLRKPKRADARRNYDRIVLAAREAFAECGNATSLEEIARRAGVGIGTLYRNFPNRPALLEAVYVEEVEQVCSSATAVMELEPWAAFEAFCRRFVAYLHAKQALAAELLDSVGANAEVFACCKHALLEGAEPVLARAQAAHVLREDVQVTDLIHLLGGIAKIHGSDDAQVDRILGFALDGLRYRR